MSTAGFLPIFLFLGRGGLGEAEGEKGGREEEGEREGGREGGRERERGREGGRERGREEGREGGRERGREGNHVCLREVAYVHVYEILAQRKIAAYMYMDLII